MKIAIISDIHANPEAFGSGYARNGVSCKIARYNQLRRLCL